MLATLLSLTFVIPAVWFVYTLRAWWVARADWDEFSPDTKAFYLLVAPPLTLALDLLVLTDRLFYWPRHREQRPDGVRRRSMARAVIAAAGLVALADLAVAGEGGSAEQPPPIAESNVVLEEPDQSPRQPYLNASEAAAVQYRDLAPEDPGATPAANGEK